MADNKSLEYCFLNIIDFVKAKLEVKEICALSRVSQMYNNTIKNIIKWYNHAESNNEK